MDINKIFDDNKFRNIINNYQDDSFSKITTILNYEKTFRNLSSDLSKYGMFLMTEYAKKVITNNDFFNKKYPYSSIVIDSFNSFAINPLNINYFDDAFCSINFKTNTYKFIHRDFTSVLNNHEKVFSFISEKEEKINIIKNYSIYTYNNQELRRQLFFEILSDFNIFKNIKKSWKYVSDKKIDFYTNNIFMKLLFVLFHLINIKEIIKNFSLYKNFNSKILITKKRYNEIIQNYQEEIDIAKMDDEIIKLSLYPYMSYLQSFENDLKKLLHEKGLKEEQHNTEYLGNIRDELKQYYFLFISKDSDFVSRCKQKNRVRDSNYATISKL